MIELDRIFIDDFTRMNKTEDFLIDRKNFVNEHKGVKKIEDKYYSNGKVDKFGNRIIERKYYFKDGWVSVFRPHRTCSKWKLEPLPEEQL